MKLLTYLLALLSSAPALGAEVMAVSSGRKNIAVAQEPGNPWAIRDRACVTQNQTDLVCGTVTKVTTKGAIVALDIAYDNVSIGDQVRKLGSSRKLTAETVETFNAHQTPKQFDLTAGLGVGLSFFYPMLHFQVGITPHLALGLQPLYYKAAGGATSISAIGALVTLNYYKDPYFRGLWISLGAGMNSISLEDSVLGTSESATSTIGLLTAGWRGRWASGWNAGIGGGIQYLTDPAFSAIVLTSAGIQPVLTLDFGFNF